MVVLDFENSCKLTNIVVCFTTRGKVVSVLLVSKLKKKIETIPYKFKSKGLSRFIEDTSIYLMCFEKYPYIIVRSPSFVVSQYKIKVTKHSVYKVYIS